MKVALGSMVTDSITGFSGIVVARIEYLNGCIQYEVQPKALHEGKPVATKWLDEQRLAEKQPDKDKARPGGPGDHPAAPSRPGQRR